MRAVHDVDAVRAAEDALMARLPPGVLMQRAAAGLAARCAALVRPVYGARVVLLVGSGNNGGDALYAGARLARRGARVDALLLGPAHPAGLAALRASGGRVRDAGTSADVVLLDGARLVVDGILGIGGQGALRPAAARLADLAGLARRSGAVVVAVDLPSGVAASTGRVAGPAVRADVTVTFGTLKPGLVAMPGAEYAGRVHLVDIGLGPVLPPAAVGEPEVEDVAGWLSRPGPGDHKYTRGVLGVAAGSAGYPGAAVLVSSAAARAGVGMVRYCGPAPVAGAVLAARPEVVVSGSVAATGQVQAWVAGSGLGTDEAAARTVDAVLGAATPTVLDADALTRVVRAPGVLAGHPGPVVVTPHAGEAARLLGAGRTDVEAEPLAGARALAAALRVHVLLKGYRTVVAAPDGTALVNPVATPWLGTAGSGDVLTGLVGALLAQGLPAMRAAAAAAYLHGAAGRIAAAGPPGGATGSVSGPMTAADLVACLPEAFRVVWLAAGLDPADGA